MTAADVKSVDTIAVGDEFDGWRVESIGHVRNRQKCCWCRCVCGAAVRLVSVYRLVQRRSKSCGCLKSAAISRVFRTHGRSNTSEYNIWRSMRARCNNSNTEAYEDYGARGIRVCDAWNDSFAAFFQDMGPRPSRRHTIERKDNDKGYSPDNCQWAIWEEQARNRRSTLCVVYRGREHVLIELTKSRGIAYHTVYGRLRRGWSVEDAVDRPARAAMARGGQAG